MKVPSFSVNLAGPLLWLVKKLLKRGSPASTECQL